MSEDKSKLQLLGEIAQANNKNLELIEELNDREDEIERLNNIIKKFDKLIKNEINESKLEQELQQKENIIKEVREYINNTELGKGTEYYRIQILQILDKESK